MSGPYRVEIDDPGCAYCQHDMSYNVIGPDDVASSTSYGDEEEANALRNALNHAYELGQQSNRVQLGNPWTAFAEGSMPPNGSPLLVWDAQFDSITSCYFIASHDTLESLRERQYTHWILVSSLIRPADLTPKKPVQVPTLAAAPPQEPPPAEPAAIQSLLVDEKDPAYWDDMPF